MPPLRAAALALIVATTTPAAVAAQAHGNSSRSRPYSQLRVRVSGVRNVNHDVMHDFWRAGTGGAIGVTTPFYVGSVGAGAALIPFRARAGGRPNFRALLLGLDWGGDISLPSPFRARAVARVGDFVMLIENPDLWLDSESELFVGGELSGAVALGHSLALVVAGSYARVHTRPSLDLALLTVGLEYGTRTPGWLRAILE